MQTETQNTYLVRTDKGYIRAGEGSYKESLLLAIRLYGGTLAAHSIRRRVDGPYTQKEWEYVRDYQDEALGKIRFNARGEKFTCGKQTAEEILRDLETYPEFKE